MSGSETTIGDPSDTLRVRLALAALALLAMLAVAVFAVTLWPAAAVAAVIAAVLLSAAAMVLARFTGCVRIADEAVLIEPFLAGRRRLLRSEFDSVVVARMLLPSRGEGETRRVVFLEAGAAVAAVSPLRRFQVRELTDAGLPVGEDHELLTPRALQRRYPGAVSVGERVLAMLPALAISIGVVGAAVAIGVSGW